MLNWLSRIVFKKQLAELDKIKKDLLLSIKEAEEKGNFIRRVNTVVLDPEDPDSIQFKKEIASIWKTNRFRFLLHLIRNEIVGELLNGGEAAQRNIPGMIKGIDSLAIKMQTMSKEVERIDNEEIQS